MKFTDLVKVPTNINEGLSPVSNKYMLYKFGDPRDSYNQNCQPITNKKISLHIIPKNVGPFKIIGYDKAVQSLEEILLEIKNSYPEIYAILGTEGMLCCRLVRGSVKSISNHSWGMAIDLTLNKQLDERGDGKSQYGLTLISPIFNKHKWYWGAGFNTEDCMHFECSKDLVDNW